MNQVVVSGMRPTGPLHLGHYFGVLNNWKRLQEKYDCYFFIADWHALTTDYDNTERLQQHRKSVLKDWLASGIDPEKCTIFLQSDVPEHAELHLLMEMITPEGWLKRNPTYKEAREEMGEKRTRHVGFLSYPVLQTADVLAYKGTRVPVGEDQKPHLELGRRIIRRFNDLYDADLPEMEAILNHAPRLLGMDGRKMSKSYGNTIDLSDSPEGRKDKIMGAQTDMGPDPGEEVPQEGPVANLFRLLELVEANDLVEQYEEEYTSGEIQYGYMKQDLAEAMNEFFFEFDERRRELEQSPERLEEILETGKQVAREKASKTLGEVKQHMNFTTTR
ncbi:MAG: tryptophan--tRNA ligase [bacterium]